MGRGRRKSWTIQNPSIGIFEVVLDSWRYFNDFIDKQIRDYSTYIFRGQADSRWDLVPSYYRVSKPARELHEHMEAFKLSTRGRRGESPKTLSENEWWALGRHSGLKTPLLDWTLSPFVALFFAFLEETNSDVTHRAVYGLGSHHVALTSSQLRLDYAVQKAQYDQKYKPASGFGSLLSATLEQHSRVESGTIPPPPVRPVTVEVFQPFLDESSRLVSQRGLFTKVSEGGQSIEQWFRDNRPKENSWAMFKVLIPNMERAECLTMLNRMNINHLSLFPDVVGAAEHCNKALEVSNYELSLPQFYTTELE